MAGTMDEEKHETQKDDQEPSLPESGPASQQGNSVSSAQAPSEPRPGYPTPPAEWRQGYSMDNDDSTSENDVNSTSGESPSSDKTPVAAAVGSIMFKLSPSQAQNLNSARSLVIAAQVAAVVSLFFGGVLLGAVALVLAIVGYLKLNAIASELPDKTVKAALKRAGIVAIAMSAFALILNAITLAVMMPTITYIMQTGDYSAIFGGAPTTGGGSANSTWG